MHFANANPLQLYYYLVWTHQNTPYKYKANLYQKYWQAFCVFLPVKSVGVMGDERTHDHTMAIRIVESTDGMTANWAHIPYEVLQKVSSRIINEVPGISRVVYDVSSKPPSTIEWE